MNIEISNYFKQLLINEGVPQDNHYLSISSSPEDEVTVGIECLDIQHNRLISKISSMSGIIIRDLLKILRKHYLDIDFLFVRLTKDYTGVSFIFKIIKTYINLNIFPSDLLIIFKHLLSDNDYEKLLEVLRVKYYPDLHV